MGVVARPLPVRWVGVAVHGGDPPAGHLSSAHTRAWSWASALVGAR